MSKRVGKIFIISGPSGSGKTTLCGRLLRSRIGLVKSVSCTTRLPRKGERARVDYIYLTEKQFKGTVKKKGFLEHACVFGKYYGTPKKPVLSATRQGKDVLLNIDVQGALQVKRAKKDAILIFILPPSFGALKQRLFRRSSDSSVQIKKRLRVAHRELRAVKQYDYAVVNDSMKEAIATLRAIIIAERCKRGRVQF